jgi:hypothetical protein
MLLLRGFNDTKVVIFNDSTTAAEFFSGFAGYNLKNLGTTLKWQFDLTDSPRSSLSASWRIKRVTS